VKWNQSQGRSPIDVHIHIDGDQDGLILLVLHELAHVVASEVLDLDAAVADDLEEEIIEAWGKALWVYVDADTRKRTWWRNAIAAKLN